MNTNESTSPIKRLIYILFSVLILLTMISCGKGKVTQALTNASFDDAQQEKSEEKKQTEKEHAEIITAAKQLKSILDVRIESPTPLRMEGIVVTTQSGKTPLRNIVPDNVLYNVVKEANEQSIKDLFQLVKAKELPISMDLKARLTPTGSDKSTVEAYELVIKDSKSYAKACFPVSLTLSKNFFDKTSPESKKDFCATIKMKDGLFDGFMLFDLKAKPIGNITMPIASTLSPQDFKMIIEYEEEIKLISQQHVIKQSHVIILQMTEITTVKNDFKK